MNNGQKGGTVYAFNNVNRCVMAIVLDPMFWIKCGAAAFKAGDYSWSNSAVLIAEKLAPQELVIMKPTEALGIYGAITKGLPARVVKASMFVEYFGRALETTFVMFFKEKSEVWYPAGFLIPTQNGEEKFIHLA